MSKSPPAKRYGLEIVGESREPHWFTDEQELRAHLHLMKTLPVDGGVQIRLTEYTLTRVAIHEGTKA